METTSDTLATTCEQPDTSAHMEVLDLEEPRQQQQQQEQEEESEPITEDDAASEEKPPEYETLQMEDDASPLDYETLVALDQSPKPNGSLMVEAPPSYKQLFGAKEENQTDGVRRTRIRGQRSGRRAHTVSRRQRQAQTSSPLNSLRNRFPSLNKTTVAFIFTICLLLCLAIPIAMLVIGFMNLHICGEVQVPLYLIIAGFVIAAEVIVHSLLCIAAAKCEGTSTYRTLRLCDCLAFFLLVWLLIGSNWVFKLSVSQTHKKCELSDEVTIATPFDASNNNTEVILSPTEFSVTTPMSGVCDCEQGVYVFTTVVIVLQYILALIVVIGCCSKVWKNTWGSNSD